MKRRDLYFALFMLLASAAFSASLLALAKLSYNNDAYSHIVLIPLVSAFLVYLERRKIFARVEYCLGGGVVAVIAGIGGFYAGREHFVSPGKIGHLAVMALSLVFVWIGGFVCCYGTRALKAAIFPALFLLLMVPIPGLLLNKIIFALQTGSAETTYALFRLVRVPVLKQGFVFSLPGVSIRIARECSGIRSSVALLIVSLLAGHFFLRSGWRKLSFSLMIVPVTVIKNAIRIATLALLSAYVNRGFMTGHLHHQGGIPFSMIAIAMLVPLLWWLQKSESRTRTRLRDTLPAMAKGSAAP
ncbi:MAG: exosortase/archaeosortase family protein [Terriglobia bacterium]